MKKGRKKSGNTKRPPAVVKSRLRTVSERYSFRRKAVRSLTTQIGVYVLCDLDNVPVYVGQSSKGIRSRVQRHLTSARSDIIANRQIDVWEIAYVWEYPAKDLASMRQVESILYHHFHRQSRLMNGTVPPAPSRKHQIPKPKNVVQVMEEAEILERKVVELRLPRQAQHYAQILGHFLVVKNSRQIAGAMDAHFERLRKYHQVLGGLVSEDET
jgi:hypothetical protein